MKKGSFPNHSFVISTGAQRSGEICGSFSSSHAVSLAPGATVQTAADLRGEGLSARTLIMQHESAFQARNPAGDAGAEFLVFIAEFSAQGRLFIKNYKSEKSQPNNKSVFQQVHTAEQQ